MNNSLPCPSVAGSQISSQRPENHSFTSSNLPLSLLHRAYANGEDTRFENRSLATASARQKQHSVGVGRHYCLYANQHRARVHCVGFHRKPLTLDGLFETPRKAAKSRECIRTFNVHSVLGARLINSSLIKFVYELYAQTVQQSFFQSQNSTVLFRAILQWFFLDLKHPTVPLRAKFQ